MVVRQGAFQPLGYLGSNVGLEEVKSAPQAASHFVRQTPQPIDLLAIVLKCPNRDLAALYIDLLLSPPLTQACKAGLCEQMFVTSHNLRTRGMQGIGVHVSPGFTFLMPRRTQHWSPRPDRVCTTSSLRHAVLLEDCGMSGRALELRLERYIT